MTTTQNLIRAVMNLANSYDIEEITKIVSLVFEKSEEDVRQLIEKMKEEGIILQQGDRIINLS